MIMVLSMDTRIITNNKTLFVHMYISNKILLAVLFSTHFHSCNHGSIIEAGLTFLSTSKAGKSGVFPLLLGVTARWPTAMQFHILLRLLQFAMHIAHSPGLSVDKHPPTKRTPPTCSRLKFVSQSCPHTKRTIICLFLFCNFILLCLKGTIVLYFEDFIVFTEKNHLHIDVNFIDKRIKH